MEKELKDVLKFATRKELEEIILKAWESSPRTHAELNSFYSAFTHNIITLIYRIAERYGAEEATS